MLEILKILNFVKKSFLRVENVDYFVIFLGCFCQFNEVY